MIRTFIIGGRVYEIQPPSVRSLALAGEILRDLPQRASVEQVFNELEKETLSKALSVLVKGNDSISKDLLKGSKEELVEALTTLYGDIFPSLKKLANMADSLSRLAAKPK